MLLLLSFQPPPPPRGSNSAQGAGLQDINTFSNTPDAKSSQGFIQQVNRLSEEEAIAQGYTVIKTAQDLIDKVFTADNIDEKGLIQGKFILMNDIDLSAYDNWVVAYQDILATGFAFSGTFDGNGYSIKNLKMDGGNTLETIGFLGALFQAEIKNLGFENLDIRTQREYAGAIAGWSMDSVISNCYVTGTIQGSTDTNMLTRVGGLVGANGGIIDSCYSEATVSGNNNVGGLVGVNGWQTSIPTLPDGTPIIATNCRVTNSFATGNVTGRSSVGGLIGSSSDSISNVSNIFATGKVEGDNFIGGLIGLNRNSSIISNAYATGNVSGNSYVGGLVGGNENAFVSNSLWDKDKTGQTIGVGASTGICFKFSLG